MSVAIKLTNISKKFLIKYENDKTLFSTLRNILYRKNKGSTFSALENINLEIKQGEIIGVVGPNGAGKTTLLQLMANILKPSKGIIKIDGKILPIFDLGSDMNYELTGKENIFLAGTVMGLSRNFINSKYDYIVKFSGLKKFINVKTKFYSAGMRLRLAFSILLLADFEIVLIDEVLGVGDLSFQKKCIQKIREMANNNKTIILVSQSIDFINSFCDKTLFLNKGKMIYFGNTRTATKKYELMDLNNSEINYNDFGSKEIEITFVRLFNSKKQEVDYFIHGEKMIIEIGYNNNKNIINPMFGIGISSAGRILVLGPNTTEGKALPKNLKKKGVVSFEIKNIPFIPGIFLLTVAIHSYYGEILYHRKDNFKSFSVKKGNKTYNFSQVKYGWSFK